jgi:hypothetical protein
MLEDLAAKMAQSAREVCHNGGLFPPIELRHGVQSGNCFLALTTGPSPNHDLAGGLHLKFVIEPLDAEAAHIRVTASGRLGTPPSAGDESVAVFVGEPAATRLLESLDTYLHSALEQALGAGVPPEAGLAIRLHIEGR